MHKQKSCVATPPYPPHRLSLKPPTPHADTDESVHSTILALLLPTLCSVLGRPMCANALHNSDMSPQGPPGPPRGHPGSPEEPLRDPKGPQKDP